MDENPHAAPAAPITEADLHAWVDRQLDAARRDEVDAYLASRPAERQRLADWQQQTTLLKSMLDPVVDEALPLRLPLAPRRTVYPWRGLAAGIAIAAVSATTAWTVRGALEGNTARLASGGEPTHVASLEGGELRGFARRAAVAHVVYSPEVRRPVEVGADQEQQLVAWLSKRLGTEVKPPSLGALGFELIGGRLLPGETGPVAQFMYHDATGQRLTLYVTRESHKAGVPAQTAFRFGQDGPVNVFYWVDGSFGYAISGGSERDTLRRVAVEVHRQLSG